MIPADHEFIEPKKAVKGPDDMSVWLKSEAYFVSLLFIIIAQNVARYFH